MKNSPSSFPGSAWERTTARLCLAALLLAWPLPAVAQSAIGSRPPWTTSRITGSPEPPRPYIAERIFPSLKFDQPVELVAVPGANRLIVLEVAGKIYSFEDRPDEKTLGRDPFADIKERDPNF